MPRKDPPWAIRSAQAHGAGLPTKLKTERRDSWRAGRIERVHVRFGGERLVFLDNQDPASYPTRVTGIVVQACMCTEVLDLMSDPIRELEHRGKRAAAEPAKRCGKLYKLVRN